jgi:hypothetical protein
MTHSIWSISCWVDTFTSFHKWRLRPLKSLLLSILLYLFCLLLDNVLVVEI